MMAKKTKKRAAPSTTNECDIDCKSINPPPAASAGTANATGLQRSLKCPKTTPEIIPPAAASAATQPVFKAARSTPPMSSTSNARNGSSQRRASGKINIMPNISQIAVSNPGSRFFQLFFSLTTGIAGGSKFSCTKKSVSSPPVINIPPQTRNAVI